MSAEPHREDALRKSLFFVTTLAILLFATNAHATEVARGRNFGLGVAVGGPTSIVGKYYLNNQGALDFGLAFGPRWGYGCRDAFDRLCDGYYYRRLGFNLDYLWQDTLVRGSAQLDWHIGGGARIWAWDDAYHDGHAALAARMPLGLDITFHRPDFLEVFLEIAPGLFIAPFVDLDVEGYVGVRFYF
jgi:hypothetical protein